MTSATLFAFSVLCLAGLAVVVASLGLRYRRLLQQLEHAARTPAPAPAPPPPPLPANWDSRFRQHETMSLRADANASQILDRAVELGGSDQSAEWYRKNEAVLARLRKHLSGHQSTGGKQRLRLTSNPDGGAPPPASGSSVAPPIEAPVPAPPLQAPAAVVTAEARAVPAAEPGAAQPGSADPGAAQPGAAQPSAAQPSAAQPGAAQPDAAQPGAAKPGAAEPGAAPPAANPFQRKPSLRVKHRSWTDKVRHDQEQQGQEAAAAPAAPPGPAEPPAPG